MVSWYYHSVVDVVAAAETREDDPRSCHNTP